MFDAFRDPDPKKRATAMREAVEREEPHRLPYLVKALAEGLEDSDPFVRYAALDSLGRLAAFREVAFDAELAQKLIALAGDDHPRVRAEVAVAIALLPEPLADANARAVLLKLLDDPSPLVRQESAAALGDLKESRAVDRLAAHLEDEDQTVRFEAAFALATLRDDRGLPLLAAALAKPKKRLDACEALRRLASDRATPVLRKLSTKLLLPWGDRLTVWATLYAIGERDAAQQILARTRSRNREERAYALALLGTHRITEGSGTLAEVAQRPKDPLRDTAVRALGDLGDPRHQDLLRTLINDPTTPEDLRADATAALKKLEAP